MRVLALIPVLLLASCGDPAPVELPKDQFTVNALSEVTLEVSGPGTVTLEIENLSEVELQRQSFAADGKTPGTRELAPLGLYRGVFQGKKTIRFVNRKAHPATLRFRTEATTAGEIKVTIR